MSDPQRRRDEDLAYGSYYDQQGGQVSGDRGIIGDTFKKFKSKYDQHSSQQQPQQDFGYGHNPSSSTVGSQQYGVSGYASGSSAQQQYNQPTQPGQPAYPGGPPQQKPQQKPALSDKVLGGLIGSVASIGHDVQNIIGGSHNQKPQQIPGQQQGYQQPGLQSNLHSQTYSGPTKNRFDSTFVGPKPGNDVKWYVDGCSYMWAVSQALENARQTIWILDWWLSPELYLRRPPARNEEWRIDKVLQRAANRGVKVNIIVYKEVTQVLTLSSNHTKHALENLSPNIGVFRHPDHLPDAQTTHSSILTSLQGLKLDAAGASKLGADALKGIYGITDDVILYWAHHEKLCLIDGQTAFMGGLDLCYGRWDTNQHPISDAHPADLNKIVFPGQDFNNARVMDFSEVIHPFQNKLDRTKSSRMGWSDISICLRGPCVDDLKHHFVDRWNFIYDEKYNVRKDKRYARLPDHPEHRRDEGPGPAPGGKPQTTSQAAAQTQGQQFPPPPQSSGYQPPAWQGSGRPTSSSGPGIGVGAFATQPQFQSDYGLQGQTSQNFPPPPPGPPSTQSQYGQPQQQDYPRPPASPRLDLQNDYGGSYAQPSYGTSAAASQQGMYQSSQSSYPQPGSTKPEYFSPHGPQQYAGRPQNPQPPQTQYFQPSPTFAAPPQSNYPSQTQSQTHTQIGYGSRPHTPSGPPEAQIASEQYSAYTAHHPATQSGPPGVQGPAELGSAQSPHYQPYGGHSAARGFDGLNEYDQGYSGQRGVGDDSGYDEYGQNRGNDQGYSGERGFGNESSYDMYGRDRGDERAFGSSGRRPGVSPSRFDRYADEAKRFAKEGRFLGHDVGKYSSMLESKLASHTATRPSSRPGSAAGGMSCQLVRSCTKWSNGTGTEKSIQNAYIDLIQHSRHFIYIENQFFITATGDKQKPVKNMIGKALVERIIRAAREQTPFKVFVNIPSVPAFAGDLVDDASLGTRAIMEFQYSSICRGGHSIMEEIAKAGINPTDYIRFYNLRNYDRINVTPAMQQAQQQTGVGYEDARLQFESQLGSGYGGYGEAAGQPGRQPGYDALQQPGYDGQQQQYPSRSTQQGSYGPQQVPQSYSQYQQAAHDARHVKADDWDSVSSCYMLGGQDIRNVPWSGPPESELEAFVSEELYIHSKVMIVDDQTVICGSANLNDRSMLGTHDSEIALIINDQTPVQSTMAGRPWQASGFAASLRRQLFRKHLGLLRPQDMELPDDSFLPVGVPNTYDWGSPEDHIVSDPLSDTFQSLWNTRARTNTEVFRKAFRAVPDDTVHSWNDYKEFYEYYFAKADAQSGGKDQKQKPARVEYGHVVRSDFPGGVRELKELLSRVKGTIVEMPLCFLQNEDMAKENLSFNTLTAEVYT